MCLVDRLYQNKPNKLTTLIASLNKARLQLNKKMKLLQKLKKMRRLRLS